MERQYEGRPVCTQCGEELVYIETKGLFGRPTADIYYCNECDQAYAIRIDNGCVEEYNE